MIESIKLSCGVKLYLERLGLPSHDELKKMNTSVIKLFRISSPDLTLNELEDSQLNELMVELGLRGLIENTLNFLKSIGPVRSVNNTLFRREDLHGVQLDKDSEVALEIHLRGSDLTYNPNILIIDLLC